MSLPASIPPNAIVVKVNPDAGQRELLAKLENPANREVYVVASRRRGKTFLLALASVKFGVEHPKSPAPMWADSDTKPPTKIACVGPDFNRGERLFDEILKWFTPVIERKDRNKLELTLRGGAQIKVYSGENLDSMRGEGFDVVVLDEAAFIGEGLIDSIVMPTLLDTNGRLWAISTAKFGRANWFISAYLNAVEAEDKGTPLPGVATWKSTIFDNPRLTPEAIAREKANRDPLTWAEEYCCEVLDSSSNWLDPSKLKTVDEKDIPGNCFTVIIVDSAWGKPDASLVDKRKRRRKDATVIAVVSQDSSGNAYLRDGVWSQTMGPDEAFEIIDSLARKYKAVRLCKEVVADDPFFTMWAHYCKMHAGVPALPQVHFKRTKNWKTEGIRYWAGNLLYAGKMFVEKSCPLWAHLRNEMELYSEADSRSDRCNDDCLSVCADILDMQIWQGRKEAAVIRAKTKDLYNLAMADKPIVVHRPRSKYCLV